jgi:hypothetical protein
MPHTKPYHYKKFDEAIGLMIKAKLCELWPEISGEKLNDKAKDDALAKFAKEIVRIYYTASSVSHLSEWVELLSLGIPVILLEVLVSALLC